MEVGSPIPHKKARIEIIPLIDIMFFLLASFMMVSISQTHMKGMKVNLPVGQSGTTQKKDEYVSLTVDKDGFTYFDKVKMPYEAMLPKLQEIYQQNPSAMVYIRGDADALHGNVIRLLEQLRSAGFIKVAFEIKSKSASAVPGGN